ncbi:MAG: hypothetical protein HS111_03990 [Kofleriaceae bacterium]|nr:hypothetical protein [Kofleriaceae bacterium]
MTSPPRALDQARPELLDEEGRARGRPPHHEQVGRRLDDAVVLERELDHRVRDHALGRHHARDLGRGGEQAPVGERRRPPRRGRQARDLGDDRVAQRRRRRRPVGRIVVRDDRARGRRARMMGSVEIAPAPGLAGSPPSSLRQLGWPPTLRGPARTAGDAGDDERGDRRRARRLDITRGS